MNIINSILNIVLGLIILGLLYLSISIHNIFSYFLSLMAFIGIFYGIMGLWFELRTGDKG
jgi:hypothetical protein